MRVRAAASLAISLLMSYVAFGHAQSGPLPQADLVLVHGKVWTGVSSLPEAEAVAVSGSQNSGSRQHGCDAQAGRSRSANR